jgi:hypothetical protein
MPRFCESRFCPPSLQPRFGARWLLKLAFLAHSVQAPDARRFSIAAWPKLPRPAFPAVPIADSMSEIWKNSGKRADCAETSLTSPR